MNDLPETALSIRQPWAWAVVYGGKDIENRTWRRPNPGLNFRGRIAVHAAKGLTEDEYDNAADIIRGICGHCPKPHELLRGGIIGSVSVSDIVTGSKSPWFVGRVGLVLRDPKPCEFIPAAGQLGFFKWQHDASVSAPPSKWMLPKAPEALDTSADSFLDVLREELRERGIDGAGVASVTVKSNRAKLHFLRGGKAVSLSLDKHYDRYRGGFEYRGALRDDLDKAIAGEN